MMKLLKSNEKKLEEKLGEILKEISERKTKLEVILKKEAEKTKLEAVKEGLVKK